MEEEAESPCCDDASHICAAVRKTALLKSKALICAAD